MSLALEHSYSHANISDQEFCNIFIHRKKAENRVFHLGSVSQGQDRLSDVNHLRSLSQDVGLQNGNKQKRFYRMKRKVSEDEISSV